MKNKLKIILTVMVALSLSSYAKSQSGIYMSLSDYKNNKLSCESACENGTKIRVHDFFGAMPKIKVINDGKKYTYKKNEVYGYRDCKNEVFRFYNNTEYRIEEAGPIFIYVQERNIAQSKGYKVVNAYFFSTGADGDILPLTRSNLKNAYKSNEHFCDLVDQYFGVDELNTYDSQHKTFKVNYVYSKTIKNEN